MKRREMLPGMAAMTLGPVMTTNKNVQAANLPVVDTQSVARHLLLDDRIVDDVQNAELTLGAVSKSNDNPLFGEDKPWERRFDNLYANIIYDDDERIYKCWYSPFIVGLSTKGMTTQQRKEELYGKHSRERRFHKLG
ncbi:MAG: hypothetical protein ACR2QR_02450 [Woeseiaceae bacterium]